MKYNDIHRRYNELKSSGIMNQSAENILQKLQQDVSELQNKNSHVSNILQEREIQLEKIMSFDANGDGNKVINEDDLRMKHEEIQDLEDQINMLNER